VLFQEAFVLCLVACTKSLLAASVGSVVEPAGLRAVCWLPVADGLAVLLSICRYSGRWLIAVDGQVVAVSIDRSFEVRCAAVLAPSAHSFRGGCRFRSRKLVLLSKGFPLLLQFLEIRRLGSSARPSPIRLAVDLLSLLDLIR